MTGFEGAVSGAKPFSGEAEISAKTSMLVVALCWIAIFSEGYVFAVAAAIAALATALIPGKSAAA
jgi:hypothetical protein